MLPWPLPRHLASVVLLCAALSVAVSRARRDVRYHQLCCVVQHTQLHAFMYLRCFEPCTSVELKRTHCGPSSTVRPLFNGLNVARV